MSEITPTEAVNALKKLEDWTEKRIADEVGCAQSHIHRISAGDCNEPRYSLGKRLVELAEREVLSKKPKKK